MRRNSHVEAVYNRDSEYVIILSLILSRLNSFNGKFFSQLIKQVYISRWHHPLRLAGRANLLTVR